MVGEAISEKLNPADGLLDESRETDLLRRFFAEFLDESAFSDFRDVERIIASLKEQGLTVSGYPVLRPHDFGRIVSSLEQIFEKGKPHFRAGNARITERFEQLISDFSAFSWKMYPGEAMGALLLHAKVRLFMGDAQGTLSLVEYYALRPYIVQNAEHCLELVAAYAQAHLQLGTFDSINISFVAFGRWLCRNPWGNSAAYVAKRLAPFVELGRREPEEGLRGSLIRWAARRHLDAARGRGRPLWRALKVAEGFLANRFAGRIYQSLVNAHNGASPFTLEARRTGQTLVTRAMGGIGDLLMMEPGLEALSRRQKGPVDFAIPKRFHAIFRNNPHIRLLDIEGPVIDTAQYRYWSNLTICPAGRYESVHRPHVKRGRVELFARAMRIKPHTLAAQGWRINQYLSNEDEAFCDVFLAENEIGRRKLIGVQPFSRDSYKDHIHIAEIIREIARDHDVLIFHHLADGLPSGEGIHSTIGLSLDKSLALVSRLDAMVSVDSAFLHAAAAFDIPVVALFGPTDGRTFTRHHKNVRLLWKPEQFGCMPCWRNEDMPCAVSGRFSTSPCVAAITKTEIVSALEEMLALNS